MTEVCQRSEAVYRRRQPPNFPLSHLEDNSLPANCARGTRKAPAKKSIAATTYPAAILLLLVVIMFACKRAQKARS